MLPISCLQRPATCPTLPSPAWGRVQGGASRQLSARVRAFSTVLTMHSRNLLKSRRRQRRSLRQASGLRPTRLLGAHGGEFRLHLLFFLLGQHCSCARWWHLVNGGIFGGDRGTLRSPGR